MEAFSDRGFRGASLDKIAAAIGVTKQALLYHFPSKNALLLAVLEQYERDNANWLQPIRERPHATLGQMLTHVVRHNHENPGLIQLFTVLSSESVQPDHPANSYFRERYASVRSHFADRIADDQRNGRINDQLNPNRLATALIALLDGLHTQRLLDPDLDIVSVLADMLALIGDTAASNLHSPGLSGGAQQTP